MTILTSKEVQNVMLAHDAYTFNAMIADERYVLPDEDWILKEFAGALQKLFWQVRAQQWISEKGDCDDFARGAAWFAQILNRRTPGAPDAALAFGEFWYVRAGLESHAINFALCGPRPATKPVFFEPQTGQIVTLTNQELRSCTAYRI